jgi:hypothetical protein
MVQVPQQVPDLEEVEEANSRRKPGIVLASTGAAAWVIMAIVGVTILRPELAMVRHMAVRVANAIPALSPQDYGLAPALPSPGPSASAGETRPPAGWWRYNEPGGFSSPTTTRMPGTHTATAKPAAHSTRTPSTGRRATPTPTSLPTSVPTSLPTSIPTSVIPTGVPTSLPSGVPTSLLPSALTGITTSLPTLP